MGIFDYFFYVIFYLLHYKLEKDEDGAKWSSILLMNIYLLSITIICLKVFELITRFKVSKLLINDSMELTIFVLMGFILLIQLIVYYNYRHKGVAFIEDKYKLLTVRKQLIIRILVYLLMIVIPIILFTITHIEVL